MYKIRNDLSISDCDREVLTIEIINEETKNFLISCCYRQPRGDTSKFSNHLQKIFQASSLERKGLFILEDFNINALDLEENLQVQDFYNELFQYGIVPLINKPTRVAKNSATLIDNILTNSLFDISLKKSIVKTSITDHFPIFEAITTSNKLNQNKTIETEKRNFNNKNKENFKQELGDFDWSILDQYNDTNSLYDLFLENFLDIYNRHFLIEKKKIKTKDLKTPWLSKGLKKSSKRKQKLYIKYLKTKTYEAETQYKDYKNLFEKLKRKAKQRHYSALVSKYTHDSKKTWRILKEITGKLKFNESSFPKMLKTGNNLCSSEPKIAKEFNNFFTNTRT